MTIRQKKIYFFSIATLLLLLLVPSTTFAAMEPVYKVLQGTDSGSFGVKVKDVWQSILNMVNGFVIVLLIVVAFAQILRININTYGIKKVLPSLVMAVVAANFSYLFCRLSVDVANVLMSYLMESGKSDTSGVIGAFANISSKTSLAEADLSAGGNVFWFFIMQFFVIAGAVMILILAYLLLIRNWIIYFLVALSPLGIMAMVLPQTKTIFNQWLSNFMKWTFMPVTSIFWLWLGSLWFKTIDDGNIFISFAFAAVCFYLAITTPFKMGGAIMGTWGKLGKQAWSPVGDFAKRKASLAWSNQAASENKLNPLGHLARAQIGMKDSKKFDEERIANNQQAGLAQMMKSRGGRKREQSRAAFGGDVDKAREEVLRDYLNTDKGKAWAEGRAQFISKKNTAEAEKNAGLSAGIRRFREGKEGGELAEDLVIAQKSKELEENAVNQLDKLLVSSFNQGKGPFSMNKMKERGPQYENMVNEYFAALTRNKNLDEVVNKTSADQVKSQLMDQMHIENLKNEYVNIGNQLDQDLKRIEYDDQRQLELEQKISNGKTLSLNETAELGLLQSDKADRNTKKAHITSNRDAIIGSRRDELLSQAKTFVEEIQRDGKHHLDGFISKDGKTIEGFAGTVEGDLDFRGKIGFTMMTRAGKLLGQEISGDVERLLDQKTPREIAEGLIHGETNPDGRVIFDEKSLEHFRSGHRELNSPEANVRIETYVQANSKTAKQNTNVYKDISRTASVSMLDDEGAIAAGKQFNRMAAQTGRAERIDVTQDRQGIQTQLIDMMNQTGARGGQKLANIAYAVVGDQPNAGQSNNASNYASRGGGSRNGSVQEIDDTPPRQFTSLVGQVAMSRGEYNPNLASSPDVIKRLDNIVGTLKGERNAITSEIGRIAGINLNNESFRRTMNDVVLNMKKGSDATSILSQINSTIKQFGGKELSNQTQITIPSVAGQKTMDISHAATRAQAASLGAQSGELIRLQPKVQEMGLQITHFGQLQGGQKSVISAVQTLESVLNGPNGVRSAKVNSDEIQRIVNNTIRKVGIGSAGVDINFGSNEEAIDFLKRTRDAAAAASQAFDTQGRFDITKAQSAAAKNILAEQKKNK